MVRYVWTIITHTTDKNLKFIHYFRTINILVKHGLGIFVSSRFNYSLFIICSVCIYYRRKYIKFQIWILFIYIGDFGKYCNDSGRYLFDRMSEETRLLKL